MQMKKTLEVTNIVPCANIIYWYLRVHDLPLEKLANRHYEAPYLAWQIVRKVRNPFFTNGTGFEGYLVGYCDTFEDVLETLLKTGHDILAAIARAYRLEYGFRAKLMKTLTGEICNLDAIQIWCAYLGVSVARLRCNLLHNKIGRKFHEETYRLVTHHPDIHYQIIDHRIMQNYMIESGYMKGDPVVDIPITQLKPSDQDAWQVIQSIGKFGHPLIRHLLNAYPVYG